MEDGNLSEMTSYVCAHHPIILHTFHSEPDFFPNLFFFWFLRLFAKIMMKTTTTLKMVCECVMRMMM